MKRINSVFMVVEMSKWNIGRLILLMESLVAKDLKVRYKRSILGFGWFLLKPLFSMVVYYFVFSLNIISI